MSKHKWTVEAAYHPDDPITGAKVMQLTGHISIATNIYNEDPACSPQGLMAVTRSVHCDPRSTQELHLIDVENGCSLHIDSDMSWHGAAPQAYGDLLYYPRQRKDVVEYVRLRYSTLETEVVHAFAADEPKFACLGSASPDGGHVVSMREADDVGFEVGVLDVEAGRFQRIIGGLDFFNPHPRFDRMEGRYVLVQHNRGQRRAARLEPVKAPAPGEARQGTTLYMVARDGSERIDLPVARPHIDHGVSGHEAWIKGEPQVLLSLTPVGGPYTEGGRTGNLVLMRQGDDKPRCNAHAPELYFGHVSTSACGRYWCCDAWKWTYGQDPCVTAPLVLVGSVRTGKYETVCECGGFWPRYESGHCHPYLTPDNRYAVFTSTRTGLPQVFRAQLPDGLLERIEA